LYYTIYKITNKIDGKFYIGKHKTPNLDDGYMGSGKLIKRAIEKHKLENFTKEILHVFDNEVEMNEAEKRLVVIGEESYNLCPGGHGGFGFINKNVDLTARNRKISSSRNYEDLQFRQKLSTAVTASVDYRKKPTYSEESWGRMTNSFKGKKHKKETIEKIREIKKNQGIGENNSQYGSFWITDGSSNRKIRGDIPEGWRKGRVV